MPDADYEQRFANLIAGIGDRMTEGQQVLLEDVCRDHPQFANDLRELWGTLVLTGAAGRDQPTTSFHSAGSNSGSSGAASALELPFSLGHYTLLEEIGRGGMGIVYRARRDSDGSYCAIKMMLKGEFASDIERKRFQAEADAALRLDHPNIIPIYEIGEHQGRPFFCMKLIEGETLSQRLLRGPVPSRRGAQMLADIARAIDYAHENGVLHRDLKPSNILIDEEGIAYVADFGLAKHDMNQHSLTRSGAVLGTPSYMAPEQAAGTRGEISSASDVYSLGAILYHMLAGRPPFLASTPVDTVLMVLEQDPIAPRVLNRRVDRSLENIAMRCLQKPRDLRYSSAGQLANDLEAFLNNEPVSASEGRIGQVVSNLFRETHHAAVLENWGLLWMWHSLVLLVASVATNVMFLCNVESTLGYWLLWTAGFGMWAIVFMNVRRRMGPVTFVERQVAHVWAASMCCVALLFPIERQLDLEVLSLAPVLAIVAGMTFLIKAGILSGSFYIQAVALFATSWVMAVYPTYAMSIFGVVAGACFFFSGLKYYRRRKNGN